MKEMKCKRCGANENRIHGFCSMECETAWEYEDEIRDLTARIAELEVENKALRKQLWFSVCLKNVIQKETNAIRMSINKANNIASEER